MSDPHDEGEGALLDQRHQQALQSLDLDATVRQLGIEPAKVVVLPDWPVDGPLPDLEQLKDGPFGPMLQAAAATAVSLGAAAQRRSDELRAQAEADAERLCAQAREEAERLEREAYQEARRIRAEARRRAAEKQLGAQLHAAVEEHRRTSPSALDLGLARQVVLRARQATVGRQRRNDDPLLDPRIASQLRAQARRHRKERKPARVLVATVGVVALALGGVATLAVTGTPPSAVTAAVIGGGAAQGLDLGNAEQLRQELALDDLTARLGEAPQQTGSVGVALVGALRQVRELTEAERRNRALGLITDIERAVRNGRLTPETERLVRPVLLREATPPDPRGLIEMLEVRPLGAGPDGPRVLMLLREAGLRPTPQERASVMVEVRRSGDLGRLTTAFRAIASDVLEGAPPR